MAKKTSQAEKIERHREVARLIAEGAGRQAVLQHASEKWGVGERTADDYLAGARVLLREHAETDATDAMAEALAQRADLYQMARKAGDVRAALEVAKDRDKLRGLYSPEKLELSGTVTQQVQVYLPDNGRQA